MRKEKANPLHFFKKDFPTIPPRAFGTCHSRANPPRHPSYGKSQIPPAQLIGYSVKLNGFCVKKPENDVIDLYLWRE